MNENVHNPVKEKNTPSRKHSVSNKMDPKRFTPIHIIFKMPKVKNKERMLKAARALAGVVQ